MNWRFWRRPAAPLEHPVVSAYRLWADAQVCSGCDTPGCGPGCGLPARAATREAPWVTETCCWRCHFKRPYRPPSVTETYPGG